MNPRIELLILLVLLAVGIIFVIKSKWLDRVIDSLLRGTKSTTVEDLKKDSTRLNANTETLQEHLDAKADEVKRAKAALKNL